ncbi:hypothetical protein CPB84DRAFT_1799018, partial [Gymnopilus junonius]
MDRHRHRLVEYNPITWMKNLSKRRDDSPGAQGQKRSWVFEGEQPLKKKGAGHGIHQSDVICATVGWLKEASQSLEYGKNYEGYWNGELFVKQIRDKIALFMVDNSQGHCTFAEDALMASRMNLRPGGKQA